MMPDCKVGHASNTQTGHGKKPNIALFKDLSNQFSVIPLNGKVPFEDDWQQYCRKKRRFNERVFIGHNAGICGGPASGSIIIDKDDCPAFEVLCQVNGLKVPETLTVETGGGDSNLRSR